LVYFSFWMDLVGITLLILFRFKTSFSKIFYKHLNKYNQCREDMTNICVGAL